MHPRLSLILITTLTLPLFIIGCPGDPGDDDHDHEHNEGEFITTVELSFSGPTDVVATWVDLEADGDPVIDDITLSPGSYDLDVRFLNEAEEPVEDISVEVAAEETEHQVFFLGPGVEGPASNSVGEAVLVHAYDDTDENNAPLGLANTVEASAGTTDLQVVLRHLPEQDGTALKTSNLAEDVASGGIGSLPGDTDVDVTFSVTVQ